MIGDDIVRAAPTLRSVLPALGSIFKKRSLAPVRTPHAWPPPANKRAEEIRQIVWDLADELIADAGATARRGPICSVGFWAPRDPETDEGLSDDDVRDEVIIFLIAGHETTGSALAFTLQLQGRRPRGSGSCPGGDEGGYRRSRRYREPPLHRPGGCGEISLTAVPDSSGRRCRAGELTICFPRRTCAVRESFRRR